MSERDLRDRTRTAVRVELTGEAMRLFAEHGYDAVTVDQIARAAGISRRSFFRYFPSKEDAAFGAIDQLGQHVLDDLLDRPAAEDPWDSLRNVLIRWEEEIGTSVAGLELIESSPTLRARLQQKRTLLRDQLSDALVARYRPGLDAWGADLLVGAAGAALEAVSREWVRSAGRADRGELAERAFAALRPTTSLISGQVAAAQPVAASADAAPTNAALTDATTTDPAATTSQERTEGSGG